MTDQTNTVLVIDDEDNMRHMLSAMLTRHGYEVSTASDGQAGLTRLSENHYDFILCDIKMPGMDGMVFLKNAQKVAHAATIIMMSAFGSIDLALEAIKLGAYDYISKPFKNDEVLLTLKKAEERERLLRENRQLKQQVEQLTAPKRYGRMIASSRAMQDVIQLADKVAGYDTTVLVTGESGTGKELVARAIHQAGKYKEAPFIAAHCSSFVPTLVHSEIFGHEKGAFTGAMSQKRGRLERAQDGILFLDEVADLPLETQVLLLRFLQDRSFERVGGEHPVKVNVRVIAATNKDIEKEMKAGRLREDFYYRLNVLPIKLPPLRERITDVPLLANHFLRMHRLIEGKEITGFDSETMKLMMDYDWPGNVRELQNTVARCMVLASGSRIGSDVLPDRIWSRAGRPKEWSLSKNEENLIVSVMRECNWNKHEAARVLDICRGTLYSKLKKYNIRP